ncbi:TIGR02757 family protein [Candidatus Fermentibacteria bacterium]|nr:TIGR02757 family protein [Candidatus Fermentibacteria bacterium]
MDRLYSDLNRRTLARTDPVSFLYGYENPLDREIVALISSGLAYGRVIQIARSVSRVLAGMPHPQEMASRGDLDQLARTLRGFRHRFTTSDEVVALLQGIRGVVHRYGSLKECMMAGLQQRDTTTLDALKRFVTELNPQGHATSLLASPMLGSACKRLHLFLRWLVRHDDVDPGGWEDVGAWRLVVPMDTHMFRVATRLGLTLRSCADGAAALEVTGAFRAVRPDDPVRYDFALTRLAMAEDGAEDELVSQWHGRESRRD